MLALRLLSEAGPDGSLLWLSWWVLGFFFLIIVVGWLASGSKMGKPDVRHEAHEHQPDDLAQVETKASKPKGKKRK